MEPGENAGHVRVYEWQNGDWQQIGSDIEGENEFDGFGRKTALSADGNRFVAAAQLHEVNGLKLGKIRMFEYVDQEWVQMGEGILGEGDYDYWGQTVDISADGSRVIAGAPFNEDNLSGQGHARVYEWNGAAWEQLGNDINGEAEFDQAGNEVSISLDGQRVAIGAIAHDGSNGENAGHVRIFEWNGQDWIQMGQDIEGVAAHDICGDGVALDGDGNRVVVGSSSNDEGGNNAGHVRLFEWGGDYWTQVGTAVVGEFEEDAFGRNVDITADGRVFAASAYWNDEGNVLAGHTRIYASSGRIYSGTVAWDSQENCELDPQEEGVPLVPVFFR